MTGAAIARRAATEGLATENELREIAEEGRRGATPAACTLYLHGEIPVAPSQIGTLSGAFHSNLTACSLFGEDLAASFPSQCWT